MEDVMQSNGKKELGNTLLPNSSPSAFNPIPAKLTDETISRIRELGQQGGLSNAEIARQAGCGRSAVRKYLGPPKNGHSATNGSLALPKAQPVVVDAQEGPQNARNGHAVNGADPVDAHLVACFAALPLIAKLKLLLPIRDSAVS